MDVVQPGQFEVEIYYCLDKSDVGVELCLSAEEASTTAVVDQANESPLIGAAEDRTPRKESLMKNFKPFRLGPISLEKGQQRLQLKTLSMPGGRSIEFSTLLLTKIAD